MNVIEFVGFVLVLIMMVLLNRKQIKEKQKAWEDEEVIPILPKKTKEQRSQGASTPPTAPLKKVGDFVPDKYEFKSGMDDYLKKMDKRYQTRSENRSPKSTYEVLSVVSPSRAAAVVKHSRSLKDAVILQEILNKPLALRDESFT